jgi:hypothetical protein
MLRCIYDKGTVGNCHDKNSHVKGYQIYLKLFSEFWFSRSFTLSHVIPEFFTLFSSLTNFFQGVCPQRHCKHKTRAEVTARDKYSSLFRVGQHCGRKSFY